MAAAVLRLGPNTQGRDFVCGDIHGAFDVLARALTMAGFNPKSDRLFSVGDLVDRGAYSRAALSFLAEPWVFAVSGNHEQMFLDLCRHGRPDANMLAWQADRNGMGWVADLSDQEREAFVSAFAALPLAIELETPRGTVGFLHAEVPQGMDWATFVSHLEAGVNQTVQSALWGRDRAKGNDQRGVAGIDRIFCGHTPHIGVTRYGNCYVVDSGAVFGTMGAADGKLSVANVLCGTALLSAPRPALQLVDLRSEVSTTPFGAYAR